MIAGVPRKPLRLAIQNLTLAAFHSQAAGGLRCGEWIERRLAAALDCAVDGYVQHGGLAERNGAR